MILKPLARLRANYKIKKSGLLENNIADFSNVDIDEIKHVLVISPNGASDAKAAEESVDYLNNELEVKGVSYINTANFPDKSLNAFGYPKMEYLSQFIDKDFDLILDLSKQYSLLNTYLISCMKPSIRVKIYNDDRNDKYYHFIFRSQKKTFINITRHCITMLEHVLMKKIIG